MSNKQSIFVSAGDPSADFPGKNLIDELRRFCPDLEFFGLGGPLMQSSGLEALVDYEELAVMGFWEVLPRLFFFRRLLQKAADEIARRRPQAIILIDYPGFNLRLAEKVKPLGIPIIYYISPQVWAWGRRRVRDIKKLIDLMLVIFPFEESFYQERGIRVKFTGNPMVDRYGHIPDKKTCRTSVGVEDDRKLIALLPGSRVQEVRRMLPTMMKASFLIKKELESAEFLVAGVSNMDPQIYSDIIDDKDIRVIKGSTPEIINGADLVITSSGTATVETAYFTTPMVIIYKTGTFTYQIARHLVKLEFIGMVNIIAGRRVVPELIQNQATPQRIASHALEIIANRDLYDKMVDDLVSVRDKLGVGGAGRRAAEAIMEAVRLC